MAAMTQQQFQWIFCQPSPTNINATCIMLLNCPKNKGIPYCCFWIELYKRVICLCSETNINHAYNYSMLGNIWNMKYWPRQSTVIKLIMTCSPRMRKKVWNSRLKALTTKWRKDFDLSNMVLTASTGFWWMALMLAFLYNFLMAMLKQWRKHLCTYLVDRVVLLLGTSVQKICNKDGWL